MTDEIKTDGQINPENADGNQSQDETKKDGFVKFETYDKVMSKLKKTESLLKETTDRVSQFEKEQRAKQENELFEKGEYEKLLKLEKEKNQELLKSFEETRQERDSAFNTLIKARKEQAVVEKLSGKLKKAAYFDYINTDEVIINPETGEIDQESAALVANKFAQSFPELIDTKAIQKLPNDAAHYAFQPENFRSVPLKEMRAKAAAAAREKLKTMR